MSNRSFFRPGDTVVLRQIWDGKVWRAAPNIVVQDNDELTALYMSANTVTKYPRSLDRGRVKPANRVASQWLLTDEKWDKFSLLRLIRPGEAYSVTVFWTHPGRDLMLWYIDLEEPAQRFPLGFDYLDQFLDVVIDPDLSAWRWKDEDEWAEAIALGLIPEKRAADWRSEGEKIARWIQSGRSPFNGWENWRPDPACPVPVFPQGWDRI